MNNVISTTDSSLIIRNETPADHEAVFNLHLRAFTDGFPARLVRDLRYAQEAVISLVAEEAGQVIGHVLFSKLRGPLRALSMAPVGVMPEQQRKGLGSALIRKGLERAREERWQLVFVLGNPAYYGWFGFEAEAARGFTGPYGGKYFMALRLDEAGPTAGELVFPSAFDEDIKEHARGH